MQNMYYFNQQLNSNLVDFNKYCWNQPYFTPQNIQFQNQFFKLQEKYEQLQQENQELKNKLRLAQIQAKNADAKRTKTRKIVKRRTENQLQKQCKCPYDKCKKQYASNLALNLHIKIKHGGGTKLQRDALAKSVINAEKLGIQMPNIDINLPPNYIEVSIIKFRILKKVEDQMIAVRSSKIVKMLFFKKGSQK